MTRHIELDRFRLKFRKAEDDGIVASIWMDDTHLVDLAWLSCKIVGDAGSKTYQGWVDAVSACFHEKLAEITGIEGWVGKRRKPRYEGEGEGGVV